MIVSHRACCQQAPLWVFLLAGETQFPVHHHPYIVGYFIAILILFLIGIFALDTSWSESLPGAAILSALGVGGIWWKQEGFG